MYLRGVAIFCLALVPATLSYDNIHEYMSEEDRRQVFQTDADSVPKHEIFEIEFPELSHRKKRDLLPAGTRLRIRVCDTDTSLWLYPPVAPVIHTDTPVYFATADPNETENVRFDQETGWLDRMGNLMEDPNQLASMWIRFDEYGRPTVNGRIEKKGIVIRSLPSHVVGKYLRNKRSIADFDPSNSTHHVAYRINDAPAKDDFVAAANQTAFRERLVRSNARIPETLYMEILLVLDNTMTRNCDYYPLGSAEHRYCIESLLAYLAIYWNGVDLRYRFLEKPQLRVSISAIVIAKEREVLPYISKYIFENDTEAFDASNGLGRARSFFFKIRDTFPFDTWDVAVTMTRLAMSRSRRIYANAYTWGACLINTDSQLVDGVSLITDDGSLNAIAFAVHELGHTLGLKHDLTKTRCHWEQGFIMAVFPSFTIDSSFFSPCSMAALQAGIDVQNLTCLYNEPSARYEIRSILLPGEVKSREDQCRSHKKGVPCEIKGADDCVNIMCYNGTACEQINRPVLAGTQCGDDNDILPKICLQNKCLPVDKRRMESKLYECVNNGRPKPDGTRCGDDNDIKIKICVRGKCVPGDYYQVRNSGKTCLRAGVPVRDGMPCNIPKYSIHGFCHRGRCLQRHRKTY